jgi:D-alanine-D-alanine ligase-like ATP-grasp enzyme
MWRLAAGACAVADFRFDDRIEGTGLICLEADTQPGTTRTSSAPEFAKLLRA